MNTICNKFSKLCLMISLFNTPEMRLKWQPGNLVVTQRQGTNREEPLSNAWWKSVRRSRADHQSLNAPTCYRHPSSLRSLVSGKAVALLEISFYAHHNFLQIGVYIFSGDKYLRYNTRVLRSQRSNFPFTINPIFTNYIVSPTIVFISAVL